MNQGHCEMHVQKEGNELLAVINADTNWKNLEIHIVLNNLGHVEMLANQITRSEVTPDQ